MAAWVITGSNGFLGSKLRQALEENRKKYSIQWESFQSGDWMVHLAAKTNVEWCESNATETKKNNELFTKQLAKFVGNRGKMVYLSTDFGKENAYGKSKRAGEAWVKKYCPNHWIIRTSTLYGYNSPRDKSTFVKWVIDQLKRNPMQPIPIAVDWITTPTLIDDLAQWIAEHAGPENGLQYVVGPEPISKFHFAEKVQRVFGLSAPLKPILLKEVKSFKAKRKSYPIVCDKLSHDVERGLEEMRTQMERDGLV